MKNRKDRGAALEVCSIAMVALAACGPAVMPDGAQAPSPPPAEDAPAAAPNGGSEPPAGEAPRGGLSLQQSPPENEAGKRCGGIMGLACPRGLVCVDDPRDDCNPAWGGQDCTGFCQPPGALPGGTTAPPP